MRLMMLLMDGGKWLQTEFICDIFMGHWLELLSECKAPHEGLGLCVLYLESATDPRIASQALAEF